MASTRCEDGIDRSPRVLTHHRHAVVVHHHRHEDQSMTDSPLSRTTNGLSVESQAQRDYVVIKESARSRRRAITAAAATATSRQGRTLAPSPTRSRRMTYAEVETWVASSTPRLYAPKPVRIFQYDPGQSVDIDTNGVVSGIVSGGDGAQLPSSASVTHPESEAEWTMIPRDDSNGSLREDFVLFRKDSPELEQVLADATVDVDAARRRVPPPKAVASPKTHLRAASHDKAVEARHCRRCGRWKDPFSGHRCTPSAPRLRDDIEITEHRSRRWRSLF